MICTKMKNQVMIYIKMKTFVVLHNKPTEKSLKIILNVLNIKICKLTKMNSIILSQILLLKILIMEILNLQLFSNGFVFFLF